MMLVGRDITVPFADPSEAYEWLMSNPASPFAPENMDAVGWTRWLTALGIPGLFAAYYGRSMEHKRLVYIKIITLCNTTLVILRFLICMSFRKAI